MEDKVYTYHCDPGHGWLEVPTEEIERLGIQEQISDYSYISECGTTQFLEEDCDMPLFLKAKKEAGEEVPLNNIRDRHTNDEHWIRSLG